MTYAGRLDPMASGLILVLAGEEVRNKKKYLTLPKEYEFKILFGFATDTYDILGKIQHSHILKNVGMLELEEKIKQNLKYFTGKFMQKYPLYSSKTVNGKQLFEYGREGIEVKRPSREVLVSYFKFLKLKTISGKKLLSNVEKRIKQVDGDFRQKEILKIWDRGLMGRKKEALRFFTADFHIKCSSGTYVRVITNDLGVRLGVPALAFSIKRTKIGKWSKIT